MEIYSHSFLAQKINSCELNTKVSCQSYTNKITFELNTKISFQIYTNFSSTKQKENRQKKAAFSLILYHIKNEDFN
jgi:hypothetical protein